MRRFAAIMALSVLAGSSLPGRMPAQGAPGNPRVGTAADTDEIESHARPPVFATGVTVGAMSFSGGRSQQGVAGILQYRLAPWLSLSASPGFARSSFGSSSTTGPTDIPLGAGAFHTMATVPWSPTLSGSLYTTLSLSDATNALGVGRGTVGVSAAVSGWAMERLNLTVGGSHPLSAYSGNGWLEVESAYALGRMTANMGFSSEVGRADSAAVLSRSVAAGVALSVRGPLTLTIDGSHGLSGGAPSWSISAGIGTAFAGLSPVNPTSPLRRLKKVFGSRVSSTSGYTKGAAGSGSCRKSGTC